MTTLSADDLLRSALPGSIVAERCPRRWANGEEYPWRIWRADGSEWAVYRVVGKRLPDVTVRSIAASRNMGLRPLIVAPTSIELQTVAPHFVRLAAHVACQIGGEGRLIAPRRRNAGRNLEPRRQLTRVPTELLRDLIASPALPASMHRSLVTLHNGYRAIIRRGRPNDEREQELLVCYSERLLRRMGFMSGTLDVPTLLRQIEQAGWGGSRDHFFHSFQNYFFGLLAIVVLQDRFTNCRDVAWLHFDVAAFDVWFFTAIWHDVGYGIERHGVIMEGTFGVPPDDDVTEHTRANYLQTDVIKASIRNISCLMARLVEPPRGGGRRWAIPQTRWRRRPAEMEIAEAIRDNVMQGSHGAAGALRLYVQFARFIDRMGAEMQSSLRPTLLLACCSMPFHDHHFRACIRNRMGSCVMNTNAMPFAALLAFIDSIQDDRRDMSGLREEIGFLEQLLTRPPDTVTAVVNEGAIADEALLWKMVEARDVLSSLGQPAGHLRFEYPEWMIA